ncbi:(R)-specific enoyl-CoA hydratase (plasmid) [Sulfitobacter sp. THAF37]|uniref:MaoC family dehydratase n=1 Tax=Sulfitobacter sp. THAF37 TaxID=2587855 RepID=UPI00126962CD|nr:MaoC family dehydratase [Sulfitobacter sp. THAF37]QFT61040.1 (R)-specific enoyl-CoA hydratase [Sulfitobacter sp. THAF37]
MTDKLTEQSLQTSAGITRAYADLSNDFNPLHLNPAFAAGTPFGAPIAHGAMALDLLLNAVEASFGPDHAAEIDIRFTAPVKVGERITAGGEASDNGYDVWVRKDDGTVVLSGVLTLDRAP